LCYSRRPAIGEYLGLIGSKALTADALAAGIAEVVADQSVINAARKTSSHVQHGDGVMNSIDFIAKMAVSYRYP
jgi:hypothetical protein